MSFKNLKLLPADDVKAYLSEYDFKDEFELQKGLVLWFEKAYPNLVFRSDLAGVRLHQGLRAKIASIQKSEWGHPDFTVFTKRGRYGALFLELKLNRDKLYKKSGGFIKKKQIQKQNEALKTLRNEGYKAEFACGFTEAASLIEDYLSF